MRKTLTIHVKEDVIIATFLEGRQDSDVANKVARQLSEKYGKKVKFLPYTPKPFSVIEVEVE
jgi:hypothetical protein